MWSDPGMVANNVFTYFFQCLFYTYVFAFEKTNNGILQRLFGGLPFKLLLHGKCLSILTHIPVVEFNSRGVILP